MLVHAVPRGTVGSAATALAVIGTAWRTVVGRLAGSFQPTGYGVVSSAQWLLGCVAIQLVGWLTMGNAPILRWVAAPGSRRPFWPGS